MERKRGKKNEMGGKKERRGEVLKETKIGVKERK